MSHCGGCKSLADQTCVNIMGGDSEVSRASNTHGWYGVFTQMNDIWPRAYRI